MEGSTRNLVDKSLRLRKSATQATAAIADQLDADSGSEGSESDGGKLSALKGRVSAKVQYGKRAKTTKSLGSRSTKEAAITGQKVRSASPQPVSTLSLPKSISVSSRPRPRPRPVIKKPAALPTPVVVNAPTATQDNDSSDLTPLSSDESSSSIEILEISKKPSLVSISAAPVGRLNAMPSAGPSTERKEPMWTPETLGTYVWVLIEPKSSTVYNEGNAKDEDSEERLWWPGKITSSKSTDLPLRVKLFGRGYGSVRIDKPSNANILSRFDHLYRQRFTKATFVSPSPPSFDLTSPRKRLKVDRSTIERKWQAAVEEVIEDLNKASGNGDESDDLPEVGNIFNHISSGPPLPTSRQNTSKLTAKKKGKRKRNQSSDESAADDTDIYGDEEESSWKPPELDDDLKIPGELVLARDKSSTTASYWPARLEAYIAPNTPRQQPQFRVTWLDDGQGDIERRWFYTMLEDGFTTCKLGQIESAFIEVQNDDDDDNRTLQGPNSARRSPSPETSNPPPSAEEFTNLSIRQQFAYTKRVLKAILDNEYEPTKHKHDRFMAGGKKRRGVVDEAALRGKMDPRDVEYLQIYIKEWCLRDEGRATVVLQGDEIDSYTDGAELKGLHEKVEEQKMDLMTESTSSLIDLDSTRSVSPLPDLPSSPIRIPPSSCPSGRTEDSDTDIVHGNLPSTPTEIDIFTNDVISIDSGETENLPRQRGSEDFESLSPLVKIDYCVNILLPEAVRQILLWRSGYRTSSSLLSSTEEEDLYIRGKKLLEETDWVNDILRFRDAKCQLQKKQDMKSQKRGMHKRKDSVSRPRRHIAKPNYLD